MSDSVILKPGKNCWRIEHADRVRLLVDGAEYFHAFRETAKKARRSIQLIGWDIDSRFALEQEGPPDGLPTSLGDFLNNPISRRTPWTSCASACSGDFTKPIVMTDCMANGSRRALLFLSTRSQVRAQPGALLRFPLPCHSANARFSPSALASLIFFNAVHRAAWEALCSE
jgi:hypothetical protein